MQKTNWILPKTIFIQKYYIWKIDLVKQIFDTYRNFSIILSYLKVKIRKSPAGYKDFLSFFVCAHFNSLSIFFAYGASQNVKGSHANLETVKFGDAEMRKAPKTHFIFSRFGLLADESSKGPSLYYVRAFWGFFNHQPTYVRTFSLHKVRENCHFLDHLPTSISLRNIGS